MNGESQVVFLFLSDVDRILKELYAGKRPPHIEFLICSCGQVANFKISDDEAVGWQVLPYPVCPDCRAKEQREPEPYDGPARERFMALVDQFIAQQKEFDMEVTGKFIIVPKHVVRKKKTVRRAFHDETDTELMTQLATKYAEERDEDFLIVQVVKEVSRPKNGKKGRKA